MPSKTVTVYEHTCLRCGHVWQSRLPRPARCPHCTNPKWDRPRQSTRAVAPARQAGQEGER